MNKLPTEPGFYWWRYNDKEDWTIADVYQGGSRHLYAEIGNKTRRIPDWEGQWQRCIRPDEGQEASCIYGPDGSFVVARINARIAWDDLEAIKMDVKSCLKKQGYTCRKVKIVEVVE